MTSRVNWKLTATTSVGAARRKRSAPTKAPSTTPTLTTTVNAQRTFRLIGASSCWVATSWTPWGWFRRQVFKSPFGRIRPKRALSYVWASRTAKGDAAFSPVSDDIYQVVARSGCQQDADWVAERHELSRDFARAFQEPMPDVVGLAVMTDIDDTEGRATAWYRDVVVHLQTGSSLSVPFDGDLDEQAR